MALKKKAVKKKKQEIEITLDIGESFDVGASKENDFDLNLDHATYKGVKGQAGSRTQLVS